jgi:putative peptidoglycan lipid II flippase
LSSALASYLNLWLLWRALRRDGIYARQPGWRAHLFRLVAACAALTAVLTAGMLVWPDWSSWPTATRVLRLTELIAAASAAYVVVLFASGFRWADLRGR